MADGLLVASIINFRQLQPSHGLLIKLFLKLREKNTLFSDFLYRKISTAKSILDTFLFGFKTVNVCAEPLQFATLFEGKLAFIVQTDLLTVLLRY